ncbi:hypothetical protein ACLOJK_028317 [Asimina triloba]
MHGCSSIPLRNSPVISKFWVLAIGADRIGSCGRNSLPSNLPYHLSLTMISPVEQPVCGKKKMIPSFVLWVFLGTSTDKFLQSWALSYRTSSQQSKVVAKFCAKYLHTQVLKNEAYSAGDLAASVQRAFFRMDEMMRGQRGWRELAVLGDKINKFTGMIEGLIWSPRGGEAHDQTDDWSFEESKPTAVFLVEFHVLLHGAEQAITFISGPHADFAGPTCGCTACVSVIRSNQLIVANAGDSRCVISRKGQAYNLSRDHKPDLEVERERILKAGGFIHAGRVNGSLNLARAIGMSRCLVFEKICKLAGSGNTRISKFYKAFRDFMEEYLFRKIISVKKRKSEINKDEKKKY